MGFLFGLWLDILINAGICLDWFYTGNLAVFCVAVLVGILSIP